MVKSNCATNLETLLYRHTSGSGNAAVGRGRGGAGYARGMGAREALAPLLEEEGKVAKFHSPWSSRQAWMVWPT